MSCCHPGHHHHRGRRRLRCFHQSSFIVAFTFVGTAILLSFFFVVVIIPPCSGSRSATTPNDANSISRRVGNSSGSIFSNNNSVATATNSTSSTNSTNTTTYNTHTNTTNTTTEALPVEDTHHGTTVDHEMTAARSRSHESRLRLRRRHEHTNNKNNDVWRTSFDIHPTGLILEERRQRARRRKLLHDDNVSSSESSSTTHSTTNSTATEWPAHWFSRKQNAVYATIPDPNDPEYRDHRHVQEFHRYRHLSRYERQYRLAHGLDLQIEWDGVYYEEDADAARRDRLRDQQHNNNSSSNSSNGTDNHTNNASTVENTHRRRLVEQQPDEEEGDDGQQEQPEAASNRVYERSHRQYNSDQELYSSSSSSQQQLYNNQDNSNEQQQQDQNQHQRYYGGQFNNYQEVPLSQGYGTHFVNAWVGTPKPQRKTLIVDTGSHYTAFPCHGCTNCGQPHHTDPYYDPRKSATFHQMQCDECLDGVLCDTGQCKFSQLYTEGSSWEAVQVRDQIYCGGFDILDSIEPEDRKYGVDFMFGCQISLSGLFITQLADGIMGMSQHRATLPKQLYDKGIIENNLFAMCFRRELGTTKRGVAAGSMTLGGVSNNLDTSPMIYAKNMAKSGWFTVYVKSIYVRSGGGQSALSHDHDDAAKKRQTIKVLIDPVAMNSGKGIIVDSGTTDTYLNKAVATEFNKAWKKATGTRYSHLPMSLTQEQLRALPTVLIQCHSYSGPDPSIEDYASIPGYAGKLDPDSPNDLLIAIPATSYMDYSPMTKMYASRLYFTESAGGVLGSNTMQGHNVLFDWQNGRIGFAESSCTYDMKRVPTAAKDEGYSTDCFVDDPILTKSCVETVDLLICQGDPDNIALLGTETWTAIVESPGTEAGASCVESAQVEDRSGADGTENHIVIDDPIIECGGDGLCVEERPCQLTCTQAKRAAQVVRVPDVDGTPTDQSCGDSFWSACDYNCSQSRIVSAKYTDGVCHEVSRQTRPCHIGACARSDVCRVPYMIHAVFGLRGASVERWSFASEDLFATALTKAAHSLAQKQLFEVGDVDVHTAIPWYPEDDSPDHDGTMDIEPLADVKETGAAAPASDVAAGMKVIVEISLFNPHARSTLSSDSPEEEDPFYDRHKTGVRAIFRNITSQIKGGGKSYSVCNQDDLYDVAKKARRLNNDIIGHKLMVPFLITELKELVNDANSGFRNELSPFGPIVDGGNAEISQAAKSQSRLLAAWSIRTEVEEKINYLGPPRPVWHKFLFLIQKVLLIIMALTLAMTLWSFTMIIYEYLSDERGVAARLREDIVIPLFGGRRKRNSYKDGNGRNGDSHGADDFTFNRHNSTGGIELTAPANANGSSRSLKKRRSSLTYKESEPLVSYESR